MKLQVFTSRRLKHENVDALAFELESETWSSKSAEITIKHVSFWLGNLTRIYAQLVKLRKHKQ